ncbi:MAG: NAD(+)/NADH kinase [Candidatus Bathyarchaeota archaeon]|nr:NAD(+)/NADH kinase [Candidatus Bathyarchaeota archaeon]
MLFKSVGIVARYDKREALALADELAAHLQSRGLQVCMEDTLAGKVKSQTQMIPLQDMQTDFVITIGGDGTVLRTCLSLPKPEPPVLAVNMGVRGFLTVLEPKDACAAMDKILNHQFHIDKCAKLCATTAQGELPDALNDVVISGGEPSKILYMQIYKDDEPILKCEADGFIVSTQTGATGYSLSAGGPVLDPEIDAIVLTPICSLTTFRSLVFPADSKITIELLRPKDMLVLVDGNYRQGLPAEDASVTIMRSKNVSSFIRFGNDFYERLKSRLLFKGTG